MGLWYGFICRMEPLFRPLILALLATTELPALNLGESSILGMNRRARAAARCTSLSADTERAHTH